MDIIAKIWVQMGTKKWIHTQIPIPHLGKTSSKPLVFLTFLSLRATVDKPWTNRGTQVYCRRTQVYCRRTQVYCRRSGVPKNGSKIANFPVGPIYLTLWLMALKIPGPSCTMDCAQCLIGKPSNSGNQIEFLLVKVQIICYQYQILKGSTHSCRCPNQWRKSS